MSALQPQASASMVSASTTKEVFVVTVPVVLPWDQMDEHVLVTYIKLRLKTFWTIF